MTRFFGGFTMHTYIVEVQGGKEIKTAYLVDEFFRHKGLEDEFYISTFEREKFEYRDEGFLRGLVGYMLVIGTKDIDADLWYDVRHYLNARGLYAKWPKKFDIKEEFFGRFTRAVIEKINDFICMINEKVFKEILRRKKENVFITYVHHVLGLTKDTAYVTYVRWVTYVFQPVRFCDTG